MLFGLLGLLGLVMAWCLYQTSMGLCGVDARSREKLLVADVAAHLPASFDSFHLIRLLASLLIVLFHLKSRLMPNSYRAGFSIVILGESWVGFFFALAGFGATWGKLRAAAPRRLLPQPRTLLRE